jgi:hypothetical protein
VRVAIARQEGIPVEQVPLGTNPSEWGRDAGYEYEAGPSGYQRVTSSGLDGELANLIGVTVGAPSGWQAADLNLDTSYEAYAQFRQQQWEDERRRSAAAAYAARMRNRAFELEGRDLQRTNAQQDLAQQLADIEGQYLPDLQAKTGEIKDARARAAANAAMFSGTMTDMLPAFDKAGRLTEQHYNNAVRALNADSNAARAQIDDAFASATGRVRAMVLAVSGDDPDQVEGLTAGLDTLRAFADDAQSDSEQGRLVLAEAARDLARTTARFQGASAVGEMGREAEKAAIQYEQAITGMLMDRQKIRRTRDAALQSARDWAALQAQQQESAWALADKEAGWGPGGTGGGPGGGGGRGGEGPGYVMFGSNTPLDSYSYSQAALNAYLTSSGIPERDRYIVAQAVAEATDAGLSFTDALTQLQQARDADDLSATDARRLILFERFDDQIGGAFGTVQSAYDDWDSHISQGSSPYWQAAAYYNYALDHGATEAEARNAAEGWAAQEGNYITGLQQGIYDPWGGASTGYTVSRLLQGVTGGSSRPSSLLQGL